MGSYVINLISKWLMADCYNHLCHWHPLQREKARYLFLDGVELVCWERDYHGLCIHYEPQELQMADRVVMDFEIFIRNPRLMNNHRAVKRLPTIVPWWELPVTNCLNKLLSECLAGVETKLWAMWSLRKQMVWYKA